jgi:hypothetical protein
MECINNDYIITIAVQMHGKVIDLNLSPEKQEIFNNVRLYSQSGDYRDVLSTPVNDYSILTKLNEIFQNNLNDTTINEIDKYIEYMNPKYKSFLESRASEEYTKEDREKVCRRFDNIIFDKSFSSTTLPSDNLFSCIFERLIPEFHGIFLVSIHKKIDTNSNAYELIYPMNSNNKKPEKNLDLLNLFDFEKFANLFNKYIPDLKKYSFELPVNDYLKREKEIEENNAFSTQEKKALLEQQKKEFYKIISNWDITIKDNIINSIRMSTLIKLIKDIIGPNCFINLFDYSCNSITKYLPKEQKYNTKYLTSSDIENPSNKSWGGNKLKKKKRKTRIKMIKKQKNKSKKNKKISKK